MNAIRDMRLFAFLQGFYECFRWGNGAGRTHETNMDWNEAHDLGMNLADFILCRGCDNE